MALVDGMGQLNTRVPLVGKVPPWRQPPKPVDPDAPRPFGWIGRRTVAGAGPTRGRDDGRGAFRDDPLAPRTAIRARRHVRGRGRPGRHAGSVAWLRAGRGTGTPRSASGSCRRRSIEGRAIDPESGQVEPPPRSTAGRATDRLGRPSSLGPAGARGSDDGPRRHGPAAGHSSVARIEPEAPPQARGGSTVGLSHWERWLEFCARIDGFPRHLSIH